MQLRSDESRQELAQRFDKDPQCPDSLWEGLKLSLAIDECLRKLNSYKRCTAAGKSMGLNLVIHLEQRRVTVNEQSIR